MFYSLNEKGGGGSTLKVRIWRLQTSEFDVYSRSPRCKGYLQKKKCFYCYENDMYFTYIRPVIKTIYNYSLVLFNHLIGVELCLILFRDKSYTNGLSQKSD